MLFLVPGIQVLLAEPSIHCVDITCAVAAPAGSWACSVAVGCNLLFAAVPPASVEDTQATYLH